MSNYEPELGQAIFGQPYKQYGCPAYVEAALMMIKEKLTIVMWNLHQEDYVSPFNNTRTKFECTTFKVHAYSWNEEIKQQWNFSWRDLEISWYKCMGRGMSINRELKPDECAKMLTECLIALENNRKS